MAAASYYSQWSYDVFLSFRGEDTRNNFTAHLYDALCRKGINTFMDDDKLGRGEAISPALFKAIERSMYSIIVLSENYASSGWCLEELVKIVECMKSKGQRVLPIFYNVDPSDVRKQKGKIGEALAKHKENLENMERVKVWKKVLTQVANLSGWDSRNKCETMLIKEIVTKVSNKLFGIYLGDDKNLVGMSSRIEEVESLLCMESFDVRIVGIWGMAGIGKTTLANAVYKRVSHQFESSAFLQNVGEDFKKQGLIGLQQKLLSLLVDDGNLNIRGCTSIKMRLCSKKVFIVLDDVKDHTILGYLIENQDSFGHGSRIIITTKDKNMLTSHLVNYYEIMKLNHDEAMEVLRHYSSKHQLPEDDLMELSRRVTTYAQGLPLVLKILGSSVFGMKKHEWKSYFDKLEGTPIPEINQVLQISYDELDNKVKNLFLDIACFFKGEDKDYVMEILEGCGFFPACGIKALLDKSFITISNNKLQMHDLIQHMGMEVVRQNSPNEPGNWSRLWLHEDVSHVLRKNTGMKEVEGIFLDLSNLQEIHFTSKGFKRMNKLRLLKVYKSHSYEHSKCAFKKEECKVYFSHNFKFHSDDLRYLYWNGYSLKSLPDNFNPEKLVELNMPHSHIKQLWKGIKVLEKLKFMELSHSKYLEEIPDLSRASNLERLVLEGCICLHAVHPSLGVLNNLIFLSLRDCINLRHFPVSIELKSLQILILSGCSKLEKFPEISGYMEHLSELFLDGTAIEELPSSIEYVIGLVVLDLTNCKKLKSLPNSICNLESLKTLLLSDCSKLESLPQNFGKLKQLSKLYADRTPIRGLPASFVDLRNLEVLSFHGCKEPTSALPLLPWKSLNSLDFLLPPLSTLRSLKDLNLSDCNIMDGPQLSILSVLSSLKKLNLSGNNFVNLPSSINELPQLTALKLLNCRRLQAIPELPSSIEVINAHNCISVEKISNQWHYTGLRHAIFTNCFKMKEHQNSMESSFGTVVANMHQFGSRSRCLQDHGRPLVFRTVIPGSEIPDWFSHQNKGCEVKTPYLNNWNNSNLLGFALCAVLSLKDLIHQEMHYLSYRIGSSDRNYHMSTMRDFIPHRFEDGLIESDHIWMAYAPAPWCNNWPHWVSIQASFDISGSRNTVKSCGLRLVYAEDVRDNNATMIQHISPPQHSSVILEELEHSMPEDGKVENSLDPTEPSGSGCSYKSLELENEDEYHTAKDLNSSGCSNDNLESQSINYFYTEEGDQTLAESVLECTASMQEQWMRANAVVTPATEHKKKKAKILK